VAAVVEACEQLPPQLLRLDDGQYADYTTALAALRVAVKMWEVHRHTFTYSGAPLRTVHQLISLCPDTTPAPATQALTFIADATYRESLRADISSANSAFTNLEWKAATVLAGSVVEALLLWKLGNEHNEAERQEAAERLIAAGTLSRRPDADIEKWNLHQYLEVAAALGTITSDTAAQLRLARRFRDLIHPGRATRLGQACSRATALAALAAMEFVVTDLTP